jgi:chromosome segregation ATPase
MKGKNSKVEVLFKAVFMMQDPSKDGVKSFLEQTIEGLKVKSTEVHSGKTSYKALVSSNLITLITGQDSFDDTTAGVERTKTFYVAGNSSLMKETPVSLEEKEKELSEMGASVSKLRKELSDAKNKEAELTSTMEIFQEQLNHTSVRIGELDNEKGRLEEDNKILKEEIERLNMKIETKTRAIFSGGEEDSDLSKEHAALETMFKIKIKEYEEDKRTLQDQIGLMSLKILAEKDRADQFIKKAEMAEVLQQSVAPLEAENKSLKETSEAKDEEMAEKERRLKETTSELEKQGKDQLKKISKLESLIRKSEAKAASAAEKLKEDEKVKEEVEELKKRVADFEVLNAVLQQTVNETSKQIEKLEDELKAAEELNESFKNKLAEAERVQEELRKELSAKIPDPNKQTKGKSMNKEEPILQDKSDDVELVRIKNELVVTKEELTLNY